MNQINEIISTLEKVVEFDSDLSSDHLIEITNRLKELDKKLKSKQKKQKISMNKSVWTKAQKYTKQLGLETLPWIETLIINEIKQNSAIVNIEDYENWRNEESKNLLEKYKSQNKELVKADKYIQSKEVEFKGHSIADGDPIYKIKNEEIKDKLTKVVKMKEAKLNEISLSIPGAEDRPIVMDDKTIF